MKKNLRITFNAPIVLGLAAISLIATVLNELSGGGIGKIFFMTYRSSILAPMTWIRAFTHIFGHIDGNHFIGNMSYLLLLGPMLEEKYSSRRLAAVIAITALVTSLINSLVFPHVALCGASGVVFAFILLSSFTSFKEGEIPLTFLLVSVFFIGQQIVEGITVQDNISNMAHIVGGIIGGVIGYGLNRKERG